MLRSIIEIDEEKCNGCALCIPNCPEGAIQIIDGKAKLVSDSNCDGLGACLGHCPEGAISVIEREAEEYDELKVIKRISEQGDNAVQGHIKHLKEHNETENLKIAEEFLKTNKKQEVGCNCPGSKMMDFSDEKKVEENGNRVSHLRQWPVQMHLITPMAPYFQGSDVLLAADCSAYAVGDFHKDHMKGKTITIACPKLDSNTDIYVKKITSLIDDAKINTLTVMTMEVPCCSGLNQMAKQAADNASRKVPIKSIVIGIKGEVLSEKWL